MQDRELRIEERFECAQYAAYHEAGHALMTELEGGTVEEIGLEPVPHCVPDMRGKDKAAVGRVIMGGIAATTLKFGAPWGGEEDLKECKRRKINPSFAGAEAIAAIHLNMGRLEEIAEKILWTDEVESELCVDTPFILSQDDMARYGAIHTDYEETTP